MSNHPSCDVCVVGGGYSGTMVCANLVRLGYRGTIVLVERGPRVARGVAYDPPNERLLLNVPAANMGAWAYLAVTQPQYGFTCISRPAAASPATGFPKKHEKEQMEIVERAFAG